MHATATARNLRRGTVSAAGLATLTLVLAACGRPLGLRLWWVWCCTGHSQRSRHGCHCRSS